MVYKALSYERGLHKSIVKYGENVSKKIKYHIAYPQSSIFCNIIYSFLFTIIDEYTNFPVFLFFFANQADPASGPEDAAEEAVWRMPHYVDQAKVDTIFDDMYHEVIGVLLLLLIVMIVVVL